MKILRIAAISIILFLGFTSMVFSPLAQAYNAVEYPVSADAKWQIGMLVSLNDKGETAYASTTADGYIGVVSAVDNDSIEVATSGLVRVIITDSAGPVTKGSDLQISHFAGIASTAAGATTIGAVNEVPSSWSTTKLQSEEGGSIRIGLAQVQLLEQSGGSGTTNPFLAALQKTGNGVAGRTVDLWRIVTALIIGLGGLILSFGLLFISSRESFFSMGRNPMASTIIMRGLWKIVLLAVLIMCASLGAAYAILRIG